jgi:hypothetical protein
MVIEDLSLVIGKRNETAGKKQSHFLLTKKRGSGNLTQPMTELNNLTTEQLREIISIKEQIESLQAQLEAIAGGDVAPALHPGRGRYKRSPAARARMAAAQRARWAGIKETSGRVGRPPGKKGKRRLSAAGRAAIIAGTKARWAKLKATEEETGPRKRRKMSAAAKAKFSAIAKARWAKAKAAGKSTL